MTTITKTNGENGAQKILAGVTRKAKQIEVAAAGNNAPRVATLASMLDNKLAMLPLAELPKGVKERQAAIDAASKAVEAVGSRPELPGRDEILEKLMVFRRAITAPPESAC